MAKRLTQRFEADGSAQETDLPTGWTVVEVFAEQEGRRVVSALTIRPTESDVPVGGITARLLRQIKIGAFGGPLQEKVREFFGGASADALAVGLGWTSAQRRKRARSRRPDDLYYAVLAHEYADLLKTGTRQPIKQLAVIHGLDRPRMRSRIMLARRNGFLSETTRGALGGALTEKAQSILKAGRDQAVNGRKQKTPSKPSERQKRGD